MRTFTLIAAAACGLSVCDAQSTSGAVQYGPNAAAGYAVSHFSGAAQLLAVSPWLVLLFEINAVFFLSICEVVLRAHEEDQQRTRAEWEAFAGDLSQLTHHPSLFSSACSPVRLRHWLAQPLERCCVCKAA
jgi:hypothetical protein